MVFICTGRKWQAARKLTTDYHFGEINEGRLRAYMKAFKMDEALRHLDLNIAEYRESWGREKEILRESTLVPDDPVTDELNRKADADVARMVPQVNDEGDTAVKEHGGAPGFQNLLLATPAMNPWTRQRVFWAMDKVAGIPVPLWLRFTSARREPAPPTPAHVPVRCSGA